MASIKVFILGFRRGTKSQYPSQVILRIDNVVDYKEASKYIGYKVVYKDSNGNIYRGKIVRLHGRKGLVRAVFKPNLPGQAIGGVGELIS